jgi:fucose 4-O-acetylase-like acetyltransferase
MGITPAQLSELIGLFLLLFLLFQKNFREFLIGNTKNPILQTPKERSQAIDILRGIAMCGIVLIHVDSYILYYHPDDSITYFSRSIANLSRFSVPAFILSSGIFLSWKGKQDFWKARLFQLILPYSIFCLAGYFTKYPFVQARWIDFVLRFFTGSIFEPYYYVPLLLQFYFLFSVFFKENEKWSTSVRFTILFSALLLNLLSTHFFPSGELFKKLEPFLFTNFIFFFVLGILSKRILSNPLLFLEFITQKKIKISLYSLTLIYIIYIIQTSYQSRFGFSNHFIFYPVASFLLLQYLGITLEKSKSTSVLKLVLSHIGKNSLFIFLAHPILIHILHAIDPYSLGGKYSSYIVIFGLNIIIPLGVGEVYKKISSLITTKNGQ